MLLFKTTKLSLNIIDLDDIKIDRRPGWFLLITKYINFQNKLRDEFV